ncbi:hypothetical protein GCM10010313_81870 [Streptomyces violarus]|nr:hypothetical protein GCM10010313_81870 [Streptomyces violarus]
MRNGPAIISADEHSRPRLRPLQGRVLSRRAGLEIDPAQVVEAPWIDWRGARASGPGAEQLKQDQRLRCPTNTLSNCVGGVLGSVRGRSPAFMGLPVRRTRRALLDERPNGAE